MRNAKQILQASLKEIEKGHWICGDLCALPEGFAGDKAKPGDLVGCALGLVSIYGNDTQPDSYAVYDDKLGVIRYVEVAAARYADEDSSAPVIKAIAALYAAIPKKVKINDPVEYSSTAEAIDFLNSRVYHYNDQGIGMNLKTAAGRTNAAKKWFTKAIALGNDVQLPKIADPLATHSQDSLNL